MTEQDKNWIEYGKSCKAQDLLSNPTKGNIVVALRLLGLENLSEALSAHRSPEEQLQELEKELVLLQQTLKDAHE